MKTITLELPDDAVALSWCNEEDFPRQLRLVAAIHWYDRGLISQGRGAEIAGLTRVEFIDELGRANVSAIQTSVEELKTEREQALDARR
jgi:predicted HTH domain antitoxin